MAVMFDSELTGVGDLLPFKFLGMPLLAVRGKDDRVRVFHNICPYDGSLAAHKPGGALEKIDSVYHGWKFDLEGHNQIFNMVKKYVDILSPQNKNDYKQYMY